MNSAFGDLIQEPVPRGRHEGLGKPHHQRIADHDAEAQSPRGEHQQQPQYGYEGQGLRQDGHATPAITIRQAAAYEHEQQRRHQHGHLRDTHHLRRFPQHDGDKPGEHHALDAV